MSAPAWTRCLAAMLCLAGLVSLVTFYLTGNWIHLISAAFWPLLAFVELRSAKKQQELIEASVVLTGSIPKIIDQALQVQDDLRTANAELDLSRQTVRQLTGQLALLGEPDRFDAPTVGHVD